MYIIYTHQWWWFVFLTAAVVMRWHDKNSLLPSHNWMAPGFSYFLTFHRSFCLGFFWFFFSSLSNRKKKEMYYVYLKKNTYSLQDLNRNSFFSLALASFSLLWLYTRRIISCTFHMEDGRRQQLKDNPKWSISSKSLIMSSFTLEWTRTFKAHQLFVKFFSFFLLLSFVTYSIRMWCWCDVRRATARDLCDGVGYIRKHGRHEILSNWK